MFQNFSKLFLTLVIAGSGLVGCASINSVSLTPIPVNRSKPVKAEVSRWIILGFNFNNDYVDPLVDNLKSQCPNGVVSGILTKDEVVAYVLVFKRNVVATGFCNTVVAKASPEKSRKVGRQ
ncbi:hypothetical protein D3C87_259620 [compost metagenome]